MSAIVTVILSAFTKIFSTIITDQLNTPGETTIVSNYEGPFNINTNVDRAIDRLYRL